MRQIKEESPMIRLKKILLISSLTLCNVGTVLCWNLGSLLHPMASTEDVPMQHYFFNKYGSIMSPNTVSLKLDSLLGSGTIKAPFIRIACDTFNFTGTIECDNECTIYVKKPFDYEMFTKEGAGNFTVIVSPYGIEEHTEASLLSKIRRALSNNLLSVTDEDIERIGKEIRHHADFNKLDQQSVVTYIQQGLKDDCAYHADRLGNSRDASELLKGIKSCALSTTSVGACVLAYRFRKQINKQLRTLIPIFDKEDIQDICIPIFGIGVIGAVVVSCALLPEAARDFASWLNPRHKEKHEKLMDIESKLMRALEAPYISEQEIIKL